MTEIEELQAEIARLSKITNAERVLKMMFGTGDDPDPVAVRQHQAREAVQRILQLETRTRATAEFQKRCKETLAEPERERPGDLREALRKAGPDSTPPAKPSHRHNSTKH